MTGFVMDASVVLAWHFDDESSAPVEALFERTDATAFHVPAHWFAEVANGMLVGERRKRSIETQSARTVAALAEMTIDVDGRSGTHALDTLLPLARQYSLTIYDAAYLDLAMRRGLPLATLDRDLAAAAHAAGVVVIAL